MREYDAVNRSEYAEAIRARADGAPDGARIAAAAGDLAHYVELLLSANEELNLMSRKAAEPDAILEWHLFDALRGLPHLPQPRTGGLDLLDLGSGGGFPAVPLLLVRRDLRGALVESVGKKCRFLESVVLATGLTVSVANARFPDSFAMKKGSIDVLTTRAVAQAGRLVRTALPLFRPGGRALLWTTEPLFEKARQESGIHRAAFHSTPGSEARGVAVFECST